MPEPDDSDEPVVEPTVRELLLARIDDHCLLVGLELDKLTMACDQLDPDRAQACRNAIAVTRAMVDETRLRAHARPLEEAPGDIAN
jgi:hypothetical protein